METLTSTQKFKLKDSEYVEPKILTVEEIIDEAQWRTDVFLLREAYEEENEKEINEYHRALAVLEDESIPLETRFKQASELLEIMNFYIDNLANGNLD